jgi:hypothetical protein
MNVLVACSAAVIVLSLSSSAAAEDRASDPPPVAAVQPASAAPATRWYGVELLVSDLASTGLVAVGAVAGDWRPVAAGVGTFALGAPAIHAVHGHAGKAVGSFFLRVGGVVTAAALGAALAAGTARCAGSEDGGILSCSDGAALAGGAIGLALGTIAASAIDIAVLARETVPAKAQDQPQSGGVSLAPFVAPRSEARGASGVLVGVTGSF